MSPKLFDLFAKILAKCAGGARGWTQHSLLALVSVAETLVQARRATLVEDLHCVKDNLRRRLEAQTECEEAEAHLKIAAATQAANRVTSKAHEHALQDCELQNALIENKSREYRLALLAEQVDKKIETAGKALHALQTMMEFVRELKQNKIDEAQLELIEALKHFEADGGKLHVNLENLEELLELSEKLDLTRSEPTQKKLGGPTPKRKNKKSES